MRSGISRGTETLVFRGGVPPSQYAAMRAPFQEGDFPGPVKYGYLNVGVVEQGPPELRGRTVFCLYPHQTAYVVPAGAVCVGARRRAARPRRAGRHRRDRRQRAVGRRAADRRPGRGRRRRHGRLLRRPAAQPVPGVEVTLVDVDPGRAGVAAALGVDFALPADAAERPRPGRPRQRDVRRAAAVARPARARGHRASTSAGTATRRSRLSLGGAFHAGRLAIRASQVGTVAPARRGAPDARPTGWRSRSTCCATPPSTRCVTGESRFDELPDVMAAAGRREPAGALPHHHLRRGVSACSA